MTEELTDQKYDAWMKMNILNPLGMSESRFTTNPESVYDKKQLTWGYNIDEKKNVRNRYPEYAAAGLYTNA
ncbi:MAG: CubicO group peptidase (beta-lactamase class C family) [Maribacter sp.]